MSSKRDSNNNNVQPGRSREQPPPPLATATTMARVDGTNMTAPVQPSKRLAAVNPVVVPFRNNQPPSLTVPSIQNQCFPFPFAGGFYPGPDGFHHRLHFTGPPPVNNNAQRYQLNPYSSYFSPQFSHADFSPRARNSYPFNNYSQPYHYYYYPPVGNARSAPTNSRSQSSLNPTPYSSNPLGSSSYSRYRRPMNNNSSDSNGQPPTSSNRSSNTSRHRLNNHHHHHGNHHHRAPPASSTNATTSTSTVNGRGGGLPSSSSSSSWIHQQAGISSADLNRLLHSRQLSSAHQPDYGLSGLGINQRIQQLQTLRSDKTLQLIALQEINQFLLMGFEEQLVHVNVDGLVACIVGILEMTTEDESAIELKTLSCNVLSHLFDANPRTSEAMRPAIPLLILTMSCSFVGDVLERIIVLLEQLSRRHGRDIIQAGGITTIMRFYDFVTLSQHRTILKMVANCFADFRWSSSSSTNGNGADLNLIFDSLPSLADRLRESEPHCVERVCQCFSRLVTGCVGKPELLHRVVICCDLFAHFQHLLITSPPVLSNNKMILQMLAIICYLCPDLVVTFIGQNLVGALYLTLTGNPLDCDTLVPLTTATLPPAQQPTRTRRRPATAAPPIPTDGWKPLMLSTSPLLQSTPTMTPLGHHTYSSSNSLCSTSSTNGLRRANSDDLHCCIALVRELFPAVPPAYIYAILRFPICTDDAYNTTSTVQPPSSPVSSAYSSSQSITLSDDNNRWSNQEIDEGTLVDEDDAVSVESEDNLLLISDGTFSSSSVSSPMSSSSSSETLCHQPPPPPTSSSIPPPTGLLKSLSDDPRVKLLHSACCQLMIDGKGASDGGNDVLVLVQALLPLLFDLSSELTLASTRIKCLEAIQRMLFYSSPQLLVNAIHPRLVCNKLAGLLHSPDHTVLLLCVEIALMLFDRLPSLFAVYLRKEGIVDRIERLLSTNLASSKPSPLPDCQSLSEPIQSGQLVRQQLDPLQLLTSSMLSRDLPAWARVNDASVYNACCSLPSVALSLSELHGGQRNHRHPSHRVGSTASSTSTSVDATSDQDNGILHCLLLACRQLKDRLGQGAAQSTPAAANDCHQQSRSVPTTSDDTMTELVQIVDQLNAPFDASQWLAGLTGLKTLLDPSASISEPPSSFELEHSGLIKTLLAFLTTRTSREVRLWLFYRVFFGERAHKAFSRILPPSSSSFSTTSINPSDSKKHSSCGHGSSNSKTTSSSSSKSSSSPFTLANLNPIALTSNRPFDHLRKLDTFIGENMLSASSSSSDSLLVFQALIERLLGAFQSNEHFRVQSVPQLLLASDSRLGSTTQPTRVHDPVAGILHLSLIAHQDECRITDSSKASGSRKSPSQSRQTSSTIPLQITALANVQTIERVLLQRNYAHALLSSQGYYGTGLPSTDHIDPAAIVAGQDLVDGYTRLPVTADTLDSLSHHHHHPDTSSWYNSAAAAAALLARYGSTSIQGGQQSSLHVPMYVDSPQPPDASREDDVAAQQYALRNLLLHRPPSASSRGGGHLRRRATATAAGNYHEYALRNASSMTLTSADPQPSSSTGHSSSSSSHQSKARRLRSGLVSAFNALSSGIGSSSSSATHDPQHGRRQSTGSSSPNWTTTTSSSHRNRYTSNSTAAIASDFQQPMFGFAFYLAGHRLPPDMPLYEAIRRFSPLVNQPPMNDQLNKLAPSDRDEVIGHLMWTSTHTIHYSLIGSNNQTLAHPSTSAQNNSSDLSHRKQSDSTSAAALTAAISTCLKRRRPCDSVAEQQSDTAPSWTDSVEKHPINPHLARRQLPTSEEEKESTTFLSEQPGMCDLLALLRVLFGLSRLWYTTHDVHDPNPILASIAFHSAKLGAKASRQLQDVFSVLSGSLPSWLVELITHTPFLFPFDVRRTFFYSHNFDRDRVLLKLQDSNALSQTELDAFHSNQTRQRQPATANAPPSQTLLGSATDVQSNGQPPIDLSSSAHPHLPVNNGLFRAYNAELQAYQLFVATTATGQQSGAGSSNTGGSSSQLAQRILQERLALMSHHRSGRRRCHTRLALAPTTKRRKVVVHRDAKRLLKQTESTLGELGSSRAFLEISFNSEEGFGLGPTLEFYTLVSRELMHSNLSLWFGSDVTDEGYTIPPPPGLYPRPLARNCKSSTLREVTGKFALLGRLMARALLDGRQLDLPLSPAFFKWFLTPSAQSAIASGHVVPNDLALIDPSLARHLTQLTELANRRHWLVMNSAKSHRSMSAVAGDSIVAGIDQQVDELCLTFTLPGFDNFDLVKGGSHLPVTGPNLHHYIRLLGHWIVVEGAYRQMEALLQAFDSVLPQARRRLAQLFQPDEMEALFCGRTSSSDQLSSQADDDAWTSQSLAETCQCDHGYTLQSRSIRNLFDVMSDFSVDERRLFLQFVTGSPRLPVGGFRALKPPLKIVMKREEGDSVDYHLPSVMTCQNYLKLPDYSTKEIMAVKLRYAIREGQNAFHLS